MLSVSILKALMGVDVGLVTKEMASTAFVSCYILIFNSEGINRS